MRARLRSRTVSLLWSSGFAIAACNQILGVEELKQDRAQESDAYTGGTESDSSVSMAGQGGQGCPGDACAEPSCSDGQTNGSETDIDCGGGCEPCTDGLNCSIGPDCASGVCDGTCQAPSCTDIVKNAVETDVDCGGNLCNPCADTKICNDDSDCESGFCDPTLLTCQPSHCTDAAPNFGETDVDCGGTCAPCANDQQCDLGADCVSGLCTPSFTCSAWSDSFGSASTMYWDAASGLARHPNGNIAISGLVITDAAETIDVGNKSVALPSNGSYQVLALYRPDGQVEWARWLGTGNTQTLISAIDFDAAGNVYTIGTSGEASGYGGTDITPLGGTDITVAEYAAADGKLIRWNRFGGAGEDVGNAITVGPNGDIYLAGNCSTDASFGSGNLPNGGKQDACFARLRSADLGQEWAASFGGLEDDGGASLAVDSQNNAFVVVAFTSPSLKIGSKTYSNQGATDVAVAKLPSAGGPPLWSDAYGSDTDDAGFVVALPNDDVAVAGWMNVASGKTLTIGGQTETCGGFTCSYAHRRAGSDGAKVWYKMFTGQMQANHGCSDGAGNLVITGEANGDLSFGGATVPAPGASANAFLAKLSLADGSQLAGAQYGDDGDDRAYRVACSKTTTGIVFAGWFTATVAFPGEARISNGSQDVFISSVGPFP